MVGDSWPLTLAVAVVIVAGTVITKDGLLPPLVTEACVALGVATATPLVVIAEARMALREGKTKPE